MAGAVSLEQYLNALDPERRDVVDALRALVREAEPALVEGMKWNAPNWALHGADRITVNTMNKQRVVKLVLHMGTTRPEDRTAPPIMADPSGLIEWSSDIRGVLTFTSLADLQVKESGVRDVVRRWLATPVRSSDLHHRASRPEE